MKFGQLFDTEHGPMLIEKTLTREGVPDEITAFFYLEGERKRIDWIDHRSQAPRDGTEDEQVQWWFDLVLDYIRTGDYYDEWTIVKVLPV